MNSRFVVFLLAILLLAAASTWLSSRTPQDVQRQAEIDATPDYFVNAFTATEMGADGRPLHRLRADALTHFPGTRATLLDNPHMTFFQPDQSPWELYAPKGRVEETTDLVNLSQGVRLTRAAPEAIELTTESLNIFPKRHYAETAHPLTITAEQGTIKAVGMEVFLADERLVLRSQVRGHYAPSP